MSCKWEACKIILRKSCVAYKFMKATLTVCLQLISVNCPKNKDYYLVTLLSLRFCSTIRKKRRNLVLKIKKMVNFNFWIEPGKKISAPLYQALLISPPNFSPPCCESTAIQLGKGTANYPNSCQENTMRKSKRIQANSLANGPLTLDRVTNRQWQHEDQQ